MTRERLTYLFQRCLEQAATPEEREEFLSLAGLPEYVQLVNDLLKQAFDGAPAEEQPDLPTSRQVLSAIFSTGQETTAVQEAPAAPVRRLPFRGRRGWVAASAILLLGISAYLWIADKKHTRSSAVAKETVDIAPGKDGAVLTLADGSRVVLDSLGSGVIATQNGAQVRLENGQLAYDQTGNATATGVLTYNTMSTPKGRQFRILLPDGTLVWLNAASSIRYPTAFTGKERLVEITGEAYLEVAKAAGPGNSRPFVVHAGKQTIYVLGTSFNITAYEEEQVIKTTLLEGKVRVDAHLPAGETVSQQLSPGQQFITPDDGRSRLRNVVTEDVIAWKNGYFVFENADVNEVLLQIARWYDIKVENSARLSGFAFSGDIPRSSSLEDLLKMLKAGGLETSLNGRTLTVTNKN